MPVSATPSVRFRRIGLELRRLREERRMTIKVASVLLRRSTGSLSRIETGYQAIPPRDLEYMLLKYGIEDGPLKEAMLELAAEGRKRGWWHRYASALSPEVMDFISLEADARSIRTYETVLIPGLLQTPDYARALIQGTPSEIKRAVEVRIARQAVLNRPDPPAFQAVINEAALWQQVGGAQVMRAQLGRLIEMSERSIDIRIIPFKTGAAHHGLQGPFTILEVGTRGRLTVAITETLHGMSYIEQTEDIRYFADVFDGLHGIALPESDSRALIERIRSDL